MVIGKMQPKKKQPQFFVACVDSISPVLLENSTDFERPCGSGDLVLISSACLWNTFSVLLLFRRECSSSRNGERESTPFGGKKGREAATDLERAGFDHNHPLAMFGETLHITTMTVLAEILHRVTTTMLAQNKACSFHVRASKWSSIFFDVHPL